MTPPEVPSFRAVDALTGQIKALDEQNSHLHGLIPEWLRVIAKLRSENQRLQHELEEAAVAWAAVNDRNAELEIRVQELTAENKELGDAS